MAADPFRKVDEPEVVEGHPHVKLWINGTDQPPQLLTVCAECGNLRTILFLSKDRWFCFTCKTEGASVPSLYPIA